MRIAIISDWFSEKMGYAENCLPKAMAALGHEVHLFTSDLQPYFDSPMYREIYEPFLGPPVVACGVREFEGYTLHRLPHLIWRSRLHIKGLFKELAALRPQIVQTLHIPCLTTYEAAFARPLLKYKLFLESHIHASVYSHPQNQLGVRHSLKSFFYPSIWRAVSLASEKCYPISTDAAEIVVEHFHIEKRKVCVCSLGVDTDMFRPPRNPEERQTRSDVRQRLGFSESDLVCIYTGRFSADKNPLCLAKAVEILRRRGLSVRGLFVGDGPQAAEIHPMSGCTVHRFVPTSELPPFYWCADIGVWPAQESTSQLDAAACGLPLILSHKIQVKERVEGNGTIYQEDDPVDLAQRIQNFTDPGHRREMGERGAIKMQEQFSWSRIARQRIGDYQASLE